MHMRAVVRKTIEDQKLALGRRFAVVV